uniref:PiggyBac transposable element-derived protein domain-containing protein n=1 Tax=Glossina morsitans morsitans TaxID=37546 RepID=A0A1B0GEK4_GLOMM
MGYIHIYTSRCKNWIFILNSSFTSDSISRPDLSVPDAQGHHTDSDRYYTTIPLAKELQKMKCILTGTVRTVAYGENNITFLAWKDKRIVTMLSNYNSTGMESTLRTLRCGDFISIDKPQIVLDYIANMGGVDLADQYAATYCFLRKYLKWWRKLFFWGLEMSAINSFILY